MWSVCELLKVKTQETTLLAQKGGVLYRFLVHQPERRQLVFGMKDVTGKVKEQSTISTSSSQQNKVCLT